MQPTQDKDTRYYIDLDLETNEVINWGYGNRFQLKQKLENPKHHRIFLTKGQFNKLQEHASSL